MFYGVWKRSRVALRDTGGCDGLGQGSQKACGKWQGRCMIQLRGLAVKHVPVWKIMELFTCDLGILYLE